MKSKVTLSNEIYHLHTNTIFIEKKDGKYNEIQLYANAERITTFGVFVATPRLGNWGCDLKNTGFEFVAINIALGGHLTSPTI